MHYTGNRHKPTFSQFLARVQMELMDKHTGKGVGNVKLAREKIDLVMARKKMSVMGLAEAYGVSRARLNVILNSRKVTPICAGRVADALGVDVTEILADE